MAGSDDGKDGEILRICVVELVEPLPVAVFKHEFLEAVVVFEAVFDESCEAFGVAF